MGYKPVLENVLWEAKLLAVGETPLTSKRIFF